MTAIDQLSQFKQNGDGSEFSLQNDKMLKVELAKMSVQAKHGTMVACDGDVKFEYAGSGGVQKFLKKAFTGEGTRLMKAEGSGTIYLADQAQEIHIIELDNEKISANGQNVLAFDAGIDWDIERSGDWGTALQGGFFNMTLSGSGKIALLSDGPPLLIDVGSQDDVYADPQSAITWSADLNPSVKADINLKTFIGRGSGEAFQLEFKGDGWLLVQPSEGRVTAVGEGQGSGGSKGGLGGLTGILKS